MSAMDNNVLHHPIKFSIKTNDLEKLKKKPDKSFFKNDIVETEVAEKIMIIGGTKQSTPQEVDFSHEEVKFRPLNCDIVQSEKIKKPGKRSHQEEFETETIKHRKIEETDQVIIEPETSSALVIRGLPHTVAPQTVSKEQSILQIFSKSKDVMSNKLEAKFNLIDRLCQNSCSSQIEGHQKLFSKQTTENKNMLKNDHSPTISRSDKFMISNKRADFEITQKKIKTKEEKLNPKDNKNKDDFHDAKHVSKRDKSDSSVDNLKTKGDNNEKIARENKLLPSKIDCTSKKGERLDSGVDLKISVSHRSSHRHLSPERNQKSYKRFSPSKSDSHSRSHRTDNRHKSRTRSQERRRYSHSKSPKKPRGNDFHHRDSKNRKPVRTLQMGPLSLRDEFLLETERVTVNPEEQLEESFNCTTSKVHVKDKRNIAERLQRLFNKTKISEELEVTKAVTTNEMDITNKEIRTLSSFEPEAPKSPTNTEIHHVQCDEMSFGIPSHNRTTKDEDHSTEEKCIVQSESIPNELILGFSHEKVSFTIPISKTLQAKPINKLYDPKDTSNIHQSKALKKWATCSLSNVKSDTSKCASVTNITGKNEVQPDKNESSKCILSKDSKSNSASIENEKMEKLNLDTISTNQSILVNDSLEVSSVIKTRNKEFLSTSQSSTTLGEYSQNNDLSRDNHGPSDSYNQCSYFISSKGSTLNLGEKEILPNESEEGKMIPEYNISNNNPMSNENLKSEKCVHAISLNEPVSQSLTFIPVTNTTSEISKYETKNTWAQESSSKFTKDENNTSDQQLIRDKVSFMISPRKVLKTESIITKIQKSLAKTSANSKKQPNAVDTVKEASSSIPSEVFLLETNKGTELKEQLFIPSEIGALSTNHNNDSTGVTNSSETVKMVTNHDKPKDDDLKLCFISQGNNGNTIENENRTMHIEKTVIMEPHKRTCNISFRIKTNDTGKSNAFQVNVNENISKSTKLAEMNGDIKETNEDEYSMKLPYILDNFLTTSKIKEGSVFKPEIMVELSSKLMDLKGNIEKKVETVETISDISKLQNIIEINDNIKGSVDTLEGRRNDDPVNKETDMFNVQQSKGPDKCRDNTSHIKKTSNDSKDLSKLKGLSSLDNALSTDENIFSGSKIQSKFKLPSKEEKVIELSESKLPSMDVKNGDRLSAMTLVKCFSDQKMSTDKDESIKIAIGKSDMQCEKNISESIMQESTLSLKKAVCYDKIEDRVEMEQLKEPTKEINSYTLNTALDLEQLLSIDSSKEKDGCLKETNPTKLSVDKVMSVRKYRQGNYRSISRKGSTSSSCKRYSKSPQNYKREANYSSPKRHHFHVNDDQKFRNRSRDYKRSFRSNSKYSKRHETTRSRSPFHRKSNEKSRQRSSPFKRKHRSKSNSRKPQRQRYDSFVKQNYTHPNDSRMYSDRYRSNRGVDTSINRYSYGKRMSKSRSNSRKKSRRKRKSTSKFRQPSYSSSDSRKSKCKYSSDKYNAKTSGKETSPKATYHDRKSKDRKSRKSKSISKSKERWHRSQSRDSGNGKEKSKVLDKSNSKSIPEGDQKPDSSLKEKLETNIEEIAVSSLANTKKLNVDDSVSHKVQDPNKKQDEKGIIENPPKDSQIAVEKITTNTEQIVKEESQNEVKVVIKERSCAEKCMLSFMNRNIPTAVDVKVTAPEISRPYITDAGYHQTGFLQPQSSITTPNSDQNYNYFMSSQNFHPNQRQGYPPIYDHNLVHNNYPQQPVYQPSPYPNYYGPQPPGNIYGQQSYDNYSQNYHNSCAPITPYVVPPPTVNNISPVSVTPQWKPFDSIATPSSYHTSPPPPPPEPPSVVQPDDADESVNRLKKSSTSSLSNSNLDMAMASPSQKSMDSNVGLKLDDNLSINDDLSSCGEFEYEDLEPQDPFQKYADAPRPEYEHIIKTEVHVSAVGKRFEYAYLKSTPCNCVPPDPDEIRAGKAACDDNCFNRKIKVECNRNCPVYDLCTNRRFQDHIYAPIEPFYCGSNKGWGVRSLSNILPGTFVIEYVGELIDFDEFSKRVHQTATYNHHFLMVIQKDMYIDAGTKGNWARFVNHSCDPNTTIERWVINGKTRIGFFSKKAIRKDEEITIDYQFQQYGSVEQKCFCGSANCTGIMGKVNEKLQEQIRTVSIRRRNDLIQRIISRKSLKEITHVSEMITVIKEHTLDRDTFVSFLDVLLNTGSHLCIRTFIECGGLNIITVYLDTVPWDDWQLKLLYLQCLDHFKLRKRTLVSSGYTSATVVEYWSENPRYETEHIAEDSLNIDSFNDDSESVSDDLEPIPLSDECPIQFSLPSTVAAIGEIEKQVQSLALKIKDYFSSEKEKFFIPKIKGNQNEFLNEFGANDSESKSISIASSVQGDFVQLKTRKLRRKCTEVIQKLPKEEFRRLFSERYKKSVVEKTQSLAAVETVDNDKNEEFFQTIKQLLSNVIVEEINNLKQNEQFSSMPLEFQNSDIDAILSRLNIVDNESLLPLLNPQQEDKSGSLSNYSKSSDDTPKAEQEAYLSNTDQLPPNWRFCRSDNGRIYFYHTISKKTQWETPIYPWDAGEHDPGSYDFGDAHNYQVSVEDVKEMLIKYKMNYKEQRLQERQQRRHERTLQRKLSLSDGERNKIKFSREVFKAVKVLMKPYFSSSCKIGRVKTKVDLKFLCEKFADTIIGKEVKAVASLEDLELNSDVTSKINSYVFKYMSSQGRYFKRSKKLKPKSDVTGEGSKAESFGGSSTPVPYL